MSVISNLRWKFDHTFRVRRVEETIDNILKVCPKDVFYICNRTNELVELMINNPEQLKERIDRYEIMYG